MGDALSLLLLPFAASVAFVLVHAYFGIHVLRRQIVFADLALAQLSALGATVAFANGYSPTSPQGFGYALAFTAIGAALLTFTRSLARFVSQEAFVGILYVVATAFTILVIDRAPQGAEHVKRILVGSILTVEPEQLAKLTALYAAIGILHWFLRRPLLAAASEMSDLSRRMVPLSVWDFIFFLSFGVVVTSSVTTAGVLLVFSFLIVPAVIGSIFSRDLRAVLAIAWATGILASAAGLAASYALDLPTGAAMVAAFAAFLVFAGLAKALVFVGSAQRRANIRAVARAAIALALTLGLASSVWLLVHPAGDQPLARLLEDVAGLGPTTFLNEAEREIYGSATRDTARFQGEVDRLDAKEKAARHQGAPLPDEEVRRIGSYQQSFNEMARGERFVQDVLQSKARGRERWWVGLPVTLGALIGLAWLAYPLLQRRTRGR